MPKAHRHGDDRICGATTVVTGQSSCTVEGQLWAVLDDPNSHGGGPLVNTFTGITIEGKPVIVHTPDQTSGADGLLLGPHANPMTASACDSVQCYEG